MARVDLYKRVNGKSMEKAIAVHDGVQGELDRVLFEAMVRAEEDLLEHRAEGHASIDIDKGRVDRYLILNDERGQKAAMSIEYGRQAYGLDDSGNVVSATSKNAVRVVGAMEGLFILHKALHIKRRPNKRVKL